MGNTILVVAGSRIGSWWVGAEKLGGLRAWGRRACCLVFSQGGQAEGCRGRKTDTKKPAQVAGFFGSESLVETFRYCYMVPEGDSCIPYKPCLVDEFYS